MKIRIDAKSVLSRCLSVLLIFLFLCISKGEAQVLTAIEKAWAYSSGTAFTTTPFSGTMMPTGNINTTPTQARSLFKFDISSLTAGSFESITLSLAVSYINTSGRPGDTQTIGVRYLNYDVGPGALTATAITTTNVSLLTTFTASVSTLSIDVTAAIESAVNSGFDYFTIRLNDITTDTMYGTAPFGPAIVGFGLTPSLNVVPIPEPKTYAILLMSALVFGCMVLRRSSPRAYMGYC